MTTSPAITRGFNRKTFLGAFGAAAAGVALAGCGNGGGGGGGGTAADSATLQLPTYKELSGMNPDFPGNADGLQAVYRNMPAPTASTQGAPLKGNVTGLTQTFDTVAPGMKDNPFWQRLNSSLGDGPGEEIHVWNRRSAGRAAPERVVVIEDGDGGHGGADPKLIAEFLRFARDGGATQTSPMAAREAVAAGVTAAASLRGDGSALPVPELPRELLEYFAAGQPAPVQEQACA
ncbi:hypothetical protein ACQ3I4_01295 [Zafaria sp. Z1313]|uniref:hypothetical protein n=1 Tax=unclassified Zafaria TaxID=2828765 RepID=UPI002E78C7C4|nr:hypothetical protein [Zafaria sp. J156]MEE1620016.1 hypothetical protein [Zafaria sp. J156]